MRKWSKRLSGLLASRRGETLAETLCALCLIAVTLLGLLGALKVSSAARRRAQETQQAMAQVREALRADLDGVTGDVQAYIFVARGPEGTQGETPCFSVSAALETASIPYETGAGEALVEFSYFVAAPSGEAAP